MNTLHKILDLCADMDWSFMKLRMCKMSSVTIITDTDEAIDYYVKPDEVQKHLNELIDIAKMVKSGATKKQIESFINKPPF